MKTFDDLEFEQHHTSKHLPPGFETGFDVQARMDFPNGFGVSVIRGRSAYGGDNGPWELAVFFGGNLHYSNPVAEGDVRGNLSESDVTRLMCDVQQYPADEPSIRAAYKG